MSTERAPQILQERLTLQLKHLNEFWGHSQWNYLPPFFCFSKLLTHFQALDQRENVKKTKFKITPTLFFFGDYAIESSKHSTKRVLEKICWIWRCFFEITVENLWKYFGERFSKLHRQRGQEPEIELPFHHWF
jgi:hypothetical protein